MKGAARKIAATDASYSGLRGFMGASLSATHRASRARRLMGLEGERPGLERGLEPRHDRDDASSFVSSSPIYIDSAALPRLRDICGLPRRVPRRVVRAPVFGTRPRQHRPRELRARCDAAVREQFARSLIRRRADGRSGGAEPYPASRPDAVSHLHPVRCRVYREGSRVESGFCVVRYSDVVQMKSRRSPAHRTTIVISFLLVDFFEEEDRLQ